MSEFLHSEHRKTRQAHKCWGCYTEIPAGTKDVYAFVCVSDGIAFTGYYCLECERFVNEKCHKCRECYDEEKAYQGYIKECYKQEDAK